MELARLKGQAPYIQVTFERFGDAVRAFHHEVLWAMSSYVLTARSRQAYMLSAPRPIRCRHVKQSARHFISRSLATAGAVCAVPLFYRLRRYAVPAVLWATAFHCTSCCSPTFAADPAPFLACHFLCFFVCSKSAPPHLCISVSLHRFPHNRAAVAD